MLSLDADLWQRLLDGAWVSVQVTLLALVWGTVVAVVLGVASLSFHNIIVQGAIRVYVEVLRGVSAVILLFWCFYTLPLFGVTLGPMQAGVLAMGLNLSAYGTEIVRGAVQAVPKGQTEAAIAVNLSPLRRIWSIILPQAARTILPPYGNLTIEVLKASALVSLIGLVDLTNTAQNIRRLREAPSENVFLAVLILYFAMSLIATGLFRLAERYYGRGADGRQLGGPGPLGAGAVK